MTEARLSVYRVCVFSLIVSFLLAGSGCFPSVKPIIDILNEAIGSLENQSANWRIVLEATKDELIKNGHTIVANSVSDMLSRTISDVGIEARCYTDFLRDRVKEDLIRLRAQYTHEELTLVPVFCNPTPSSIDYELVQKNLLKSLEISGYNLDASSIRVYLLDTNNNRADVTDALATPTQYLITLGLGSTGVKLNPQSNKLIFVLTSNLERSVNIDQPLPTDETYSFVPNPIKGLCPTRTGSGDKDFAGHGPDVNASAELYVKDGDSLWIRSKLSAVETRKDWTAAEGTWDHPIWSAPMGSTIVDFSPKGTSTTSYTDNNHQLDKPRIEGSPLVGLFEIMADTGGNDVGNCTSDDVYMNLEFNAVQVKYRQ